MKKKLPKTQKLAINALRRGEVRFDTAYNAPDAARIATRYARQGWSVTVQPWRSTGARNIMMTCEPAAKRGKTVARCALAASFKKQIRGR